MNSVFITNENDVFVNWDLVCSECGISDQVLKELSIIGSQFISSIFYIERENTEKLNKECERVLELLQNLIPNFNKDCEPFVELCHTVFTEIHQQIMELQVQKARDLIIYLKRKYSLQESYKRLLSSDLLFNVEKEKLLEKVFQLIEFKAEYIYKLFNNSINYFFQGYKGSEEKKAFKSECVLTENEINSQIKVLVAASKRKLENYFNNIRLRKYQILSVRNKQICPFIKNLNWNIAYDGLFEHENCRLKQLVTLDAQIYILVISLLNSRKSFLLLITPQCTTRIKPFIEDNRPVIVTGSTKKNFLLYSNAFNVLIKGYISKGGIFVQKEFIEIGIKIKNITSAGYLKSTNELILVNEKKKMYYYSFTDVKRSISHLDGYKCFKVESSGNCLFLYNDNETCLVNSTLSKVYRENKVYSNCFLLGEKLFLIYFDGIDELMINIKEISEEYLNSEKSLGEILSGANDIISYNYQNVKSFIYNLVKKN